MSLKIGSPPVTVTPDSSVGAVGGDTISDEPPDAGVLKANISLPALNTYHVLLFHVFVQ